MTIADVDDYAPPPCAPPRALSERIAPWWREATSTPGRAALLTLGTLALIVLAVSLRPVTVETADAQGPISVECGIGYYVFGHPNPAVSNGCRGAFGGQATVIALTGLLACTAFAALTLRIAVAARPGSRSGSAAKACAHLMRSPVRAACVALVATSLALGIVVLRPVTVELVDRSGPLTANCGIGYQLFGTENDAVRDACRDAYANQASVFAVCTMLFLGGLAALTVDVIRSRRRRTRVPAAGNSKSSPAEPA